MPESIPRSPFDQGLFLTHLNRGREHFEQGKLDAAERELEEAYLLRPRDLKVLNLLGLVYFKQEKLAKAEEVYRKLVTESPEAHTLHYNLGLICFKLSRPEEAEAHFLKALDLNRANPKINFYLGSIYERLHRFKDAIFQYRQAGAHMMVRRLEDQMGEVKTPPPPALTVDTRPPQQLDSAAPAAAEGEFPSKPVAPVSPSLLAPKSPGVSLTDTERFRLANDTLPPGRSVSGRPAGEIFRILDNNLLEATFKSKLFIKQGTIFSYGGSLTFWVKERRPEGRNALVIVTGSGRVILTDREREIALMRADEGSVYVEPSHLLACEEGLDPRYVPLAPQSGIDILRLDGQGMLALSVHGKPLPLDVTQDMPVCVPLSSIITWSAGLTPSIVDDSEIRAMTLPEGLASPMLRLEGSGRVLIEQTHA